MDRYLPTAAGNGINQINRYGSSQKGEERQERKSAQSHIQSQNNGCNSTQRSSSRHPEDIRVSQGISQKRLKDGSGSGQGTPDNSGIQDSRQTDLQNNNRIGPLFHPEQENIDNLLNTNPDRTERKGEKDGRYQ